MADKASYLSRFTVKLVEMVAAGIATAVSGYLVAHLGGYLFSAAPAPAAVKVAPSASGASVSPPVQPVPANANAQGLAPQQGVNPPMQPVRRTVNVTQAAPARKHMTTDTSAAQSVPRDSEDKESVADRVRAALANVDANRPAPPDAPPQKADIPQPAAPAVGAPPRPPVGPVGAADAAAPPRAAEIAPLPVQQAPIQPDLPNAVEIRSRPITAVEPLPPEQQPAPPAQKDSQMDSEEEDNGLLSAIKRIPDLLRPASSAPAGEAPRPPRPIGE